MLALASSLGRFSRFLPGIAASTIKNLRKWAKPLMALPPIVGLLALNRMRGQDEIDEINIRLSEQQSPEQLSKEHQAMQDEGLFQFHRAKSEGPKPLMIVSLGTMQEIGSDCAGDEPNQHFYQCEDDSYGLNGKPACDLASNDNVFCVPGSSHEKLDNDPWVIAKICRFLDSQFRSVLQPV